MLMSYLLIFIHEVPHQDGDEFSIPLLQVRRREGQQGVGGAAAWLNRGGQRPSYPHRSETHNQPDLGRGITGCFTENAY